MNVAKRELAYRRNQSYNGRKRRDLCLNVHTDSQKIEREEKKRKTALCMMRAKPAHFLLLLLLFHLKKGAY